MPPPLKNPSYLSPWLLFFYLNDFIISLLQGKETEIPLEDANASIFSYAQQMALMHAGSSDVSDKQRRVWEPTYT